MTVSFNEALAAYGRAARQAGQGGTQARGAAGGDFAGALRRAGEEAIDTLQAGERASLAAAAGRADITRVVTAVSEAELTLQTVVALRDRVIQAYQDIMRMPI